MTDTGTDELTVNIFKFIFKVSLLQEGTGKNNVGLILQENIVLQRNSTKKINPHVLKNGTVAYSRCVVVLSELCFGHYDLLILLICYNVLVLTVSATRRAI